jgi:prephenate dehydrogenase
MQEDAALGLAGRGFGDTTRIAAGDPGLWRDIFLDNRRNLSNGIDRLVRELQTLKERLGQGDAQAVESWLHQARTRRKRLEDSAESGE